MVRKIWTTHYVNSLMEAIAWAVAMGRKYRRQIYGKSWWVVNTPPLSKGTHRVSIIMIRDLARRVVARGRRSVEIQVGSILTQVNGSLSRMIVWRSIKVWEGKKARSTIKLSNFSGLPQVNLAKKLYIIVSVSNFPINVFKWNKFNY